MDPQRFDDLARLAVTASRRQFLRTLAGAAGGGLLALVGVRGAAAAPCRPGGGDCAGCCTDGRCRSGTLVGACGTGGAPCLRCPPRHTCEDGACVPTDSDCVPQGEPCQMARFCCPSRNPCLRSACVAGFCDTRANPAGTPCADDGNECTDDVCDGLGTCEHPPLDNGAPCDDGEPCTVDDFCRNGACAAGEPFGCGQCQTCEPGRGCVPDPLQTGNACDDGDPCTLNDTCVQGECLGTPRSCATLSRCVVCNPETGQCDLPARNGTPCEDGNPCTEFERCQNGVCIAGRQRPCGYCSMCDPNSGGCVADPAKNGGACIHHNTCIIDSVCQNGLCVGRNVCGPCARCSFTRAGGFDCVPLPDGTSCDDGNACTGPDSCQGGACLGDAVACAECETCDSARGCVPAPDDTPCDDGDACTLGDFCFNGGCAAGAERLVCATCRTCDPDLGCVPDLGQNGDTCDDGNPCTGPDACRGGLCLGDALPDCCTEDADCPDDGNPCTDATCDLTTHRCVSSRLEGCCTSDADCDDGDRCTIDICRRDFDEPTGVCDHLPEPGDCCNTDADCDDLNPCTQDTCDRTTGQCVNTTIEVCCRGDADCPDDGDPCTTARCTVDPDTGIGTCGHAPTCTTGCCSAAGACLPGTADDACGGGGAACADCAASLQACISGGPPAEGVCSCIAGSCPGCCEDNLCVTPPFDEACGLGGRTCEDCTLLGGTCDVGTGFCEVASCSDGAKNGTETDVDCGGGGCDPCGDGLGCTMDTDCRSLLCSGGVCQAPTCTDGVKNGSETDTDCGGSCPLCPPGASCQVNADCQTSVCTDGICAGTSTCTPPCVLPEECIDGACVNPFCNPGNCPGCYFDTSCFFPDQPRPPFACVGTGGQPCQPCAQGQTCAPPGVCVP